MNQVNHKIWILANARKYLTTSMAIKIYKGMTLPYFDYGDVVYMRVGKICWRNYKDYKIEH